MIINKGEIMQVVNKVKINYNQKSPDGTVKQISNESNIVKTNIILVPKPTIKNHPIKNDFSHIQPKHYFRTYSFFIFSLIFKKLF